MSGIKSIGRTNRIRSHAPRPKKFRCSLRTWSLPRIVSKDSLIRAHTGEVISEEAFQERKRAELAYRERVQLAIRVAESKTSKVSREMEPDNLHWVALCSGLSQKVLKARRRMILQDYASRNRDETLNALEYFISLNPDCRQIVITGGQRVPWQNVAVTLRSIMDTTRRLKDRKWFSQTAEVVMRSAEVTCKEDSFHCHLHIIVRPLRPMSGDEWAELTSKMNATFDSFVSDAAPVTEPHAIARYLFKGTLEDSDPLTTGALMELLKNMRTHEPQGAFREMCRELKRANTKLIKIGGRFQRIYRSDGSRKPIQQRDETLEDAATDTRPHEKNKVPSKNVLLHISHPTARMSRVKEPCLLIRNYDGDFAAFLSANPKFAKLREELMPQWEAGLAGAGIPPIVLLQQTSDRRSEDEQTTSLTTAEDVHCDLIEEDRYPSGFDPADYFWNPSQELEQPGWINDETSFPL